jgi:hypothetical protein
MAPSCGQQAMDSGTISDETTLTPTYHAVAGDEGHAVVLTLTVTSDNTCGEATATANLYNKC